MKIFTSFLTVFSLFLCFNYSSAQTSTEFWLAPPEVTSDHGSAASQGLRLVMATGNTAATVTIDQPANATFNGGTPIVINIPANSGFTEDITAHRADLETTPQDAVLNTGLHISSTANITCYYEVTTTNNPDIFALKGITGLGMEFYAPFQNTWANGGYTPAAYTSFDIVATEDNTTVLVYPRVALDGGHPALSSYSITLNRGQTYSGSVTGGVGADNPSGTAIVSDKPIAVSVKDDSVHPAPAGCRDLIGDQIVPADVVGNDYIVTKGGLTVDEYAYLVSTENNNQITVDGVVVATLFVGETYRVDITNPSTFISCSQPTYCFHVSGFGCEVGGALLPPLNCAGSTQANFIRSTTEFFGLNIVVRAGAEGGFELNGSTTLIPSTAFTVVPNTGGVWMAAQISYNTSDVPVGVNNLITNSSDVFSVGIINGGASSGTRFGYFSEFSGRIFVDAGTNMIVCANDTAQLNGSVTGGATTGEWTTNGSGTFIPNNTALDAMYVPSVGDVLAGSINLTLSSTSLCFPESDMITMTFTPGPTANANVDQTVCGNNPVVSLDGAVTIATGGFWSGGAGTFSPNANTLNATYTPTATEITAGSLTLFLTTTGNGTCNPEQDSMVVTFSPAPTVSASVDQSVCQNNALVTLAGAVTVATGGTWSGGAGTFSPDANTLNATYMPTATETGLSNLTLTLTTTGNGNCNAVTDNMIITFTPEPTVNASVDQTVCGNNADVTLNGNVSGATGGVWTGGLGIFTPDNTTLNAVYSPTTTEIAAGTVMLTLTTTGNGTCSAVTDDMVVTFTASPTVDAGVGQTVCGNNALVTLGGSVTVATGGIWTGGSGTFTPNNTTLNATYLPTAAEIAAGTVTLTLTSTGNGTCNAVTDDMTITITAIPTVSAGVDQSSCENNPDVTLAGSVTTATGGVWAGGAGVFTPNANTLNAVYSPTATEVALGSLMLTLTSTGNGTCNPVSDNMTITFTSSPTVNASVDQTVCGNNADVTLNGNVSGATGGIWTGGLGTFTPDNTTLNAVYSPTATEIAAGTVTLTLTTTGNGTCSAVTDDMVVAFTASPTVDAGVGQTVCGNNALVTLGGSVTVATGGIWTGGSGTFTPNNTTLNATYLPTAAEIAAGTVTLTLTTTGNGTCNAVVDDMTITITVSPTVDAGLNQTLCANNSEATLSGSVVGATGGVWSGGSGSFNPSATALNAIYTPSASEIAAGSVILTLTSTGNGLCNSVSDNVQLIFTLPPVVSAGVDQTLCSNNSNITLNGSVTVATGGVWSGGLGVFNPDNNTLNATYSPTVAEIASGSLTLTLTTTGNGNCNAITDDMVVTFTASPTVDAGIDQTVCANNPNVTLNGSVSVATGGIWTGGSGTFSPNNTALNAMYTPSSLEITAGSVTLFLNTTGNGNCLSERDSMVINITPLPTISAGIDLTSCSNNSAVTLAGVVTGATGGIWTGGSGAFSPNNTALGAIYTPSALEIAAGTVSLTLTSTGNGNCAAVTDDMTITIAPPPSANAGLDQSVCANNANVTLNGSVNLASGGQWTGGLGTFNPSNTALNAIYSPTVAEIASGSLTLTLTTTGNGNCNAELDQMTITFTPGPTVDAGLDQTVCANNPDVILNGTVNIATGAQWTGGLGVFTPNNTTLNATYTPTASEITAGSIKLILTTTGNGNCLSVVDSMIVTVTPSPTVNAGLDQTVCVTNLNINLNGLVNGTTTTGVWSSSGTGVFIPSNTTLNAVYQASSQDSINGTVTLTLSSTNNGTCNAVGDDMVISILPAGSANAGVDQSVCANNANVTLAGIISGNATGGFWTSSGTGVFLPNVNSLNATYIPSSADSILGTVTITLNANSCNSATDDLVVTITPAPVVNGGNDTTVCVSNLNIPLNGFVSGASSTGSWSTTGTGIFTPNNTALNATYVASAADSINQSVSLVLTSTGIGSCSIVTDTVVVSLFPVGLANAGADQTVCANNASIVLNGTVSGGSSGGQWSTSGSGTFLPSDTTLNATYVPSAADTASGSVSLILTATNSCSLAADFMVLTINPAPIVDAGADVTVCGTNPLFSLNGTITGSTTTGVWSTTGTGTFSNATDLNSTYTASAADITNGGATVILTSTANGLCNPVVDSLVISITTGIGINAGPDQSVCVSSTQAQLTGSVFNGSTTGVWTTLGTGTFFPNDSVLTAIYQFSSADSAAGIVTLVLTSTNNGNCSVETDTIDIVFGNATFANAGVDQNVCANNLNVALNGSVSGGSTTGVWTTTGTGTFSPSDTNLVTTYIPSTSDSLFGSVNLFLTTTNNTAGCSSGMDTLTVNIDNLPIVDAGIDQIICNTTDSVFLSGNIQLATGGTWVTLGSGTFFPNNSSLTGTYLPSVNDFANGSVTLALLSDSNGSCLPQSDTMVVSITSAATVDAGVDQNICETSLIATLNGIILGGTSGVWSTSGSGAFMPSNTDLSTSYVPSSADSIFGSVQLVLTSTNNGGCVAGADTMLLTIDRNPIADAGSDQTVCSTIDSVFLNGSTQFSAGTIWSSNGTGTFTPNNTALNAVYVMSTADILNGNIQLMLTASSAGNCSDVSDVMMITIDNPLAVDFSMTGQCMDETISFFDSTVVLSGGISSWNWSFGDGGSAFIQNPTYSYSLVGNYTVTLVVESTSGCIDSLSQSITINAVPVAGFNFGNASFLEGEIITVNDLSSGATSWDWDFGDFTGVSAIQNPTYTYSSSGVYIVKQVVRNTAGCLDSLVREIVVEDNIVTVFAPQLPTAFTPNGDGNNDVLFARGGPFNHLSFRVFNEWGELVYSGNNEEEGWDGMFKGEKASAGVYVYSIKAETTDGKSYEKSGKVTLLR